MGNIIKYLTSSPSGDIISFLSGIREMWVKTGKKGILYQRLNMPGVGYQDSIHPFINESGTPVCMPQKMFDMLRPLVCSQEYIEDFLVFNGEEVDCSFDLIRQERFTNQPKGSLNRWPGYVFPEMQTDLSKPWINLPSVVGSAVTGKVIINFTERYRNHIIHYHWLKPYQDKLIFAGLQKERDLFCSEWDIDIPLLQVDNFLQLAHHMKQAKFFMGNASMCFQIAEAMKIPRVLETFPLMPNVIPIGNDAYDFYHQTAVQYFFQKLIK